MKKFKKCCKGVLFGLSIAIFLSISFTPIKVYANDRQNIQDKLQEQEEDLKNQLKPYDRKEEDKKNFENALGGLIEAQKTTTGEWNGDNIVNAMKKALFTLIIKTRTGAILIYAITVVLSVIYMSTAGSRDVNRRRKSYLILRNSTVLFFIYINIPLFLIWLNTDKSGLKNINMFNITFEILNFLKRYSIIISGLIMYSGTTKLIMSRNDLPMRLQGKYLIKFACILVVFLNIAPIAMLFLI